MSLLMIVNVALLTPRLAEPAGRLVALVSTRPTSRSSFTTASSITVTETFEKVWPDAKFRIVSIAV